MTGPEITLRDVIESDLLTLFEHQLDPAANWMAAFTAKDPSNWDDFKRRWDNILTEPKITKRAILADDQLVGSLVCYGSPTDREIGYWLGRQHWGKGFATLAVRQFIKLIPERPLYARVVKDNPASLRVLQKTGFKVVSETRGYANARQAEVEEYLLVLA